MSPARNIYTGSQALHYDEVAAVLSDVLRRRITYSDPSLLRFGRRMRQRGAGWGYIGVMGAIYTTTRLGMAATVHPERAQLLLRRRLLDWLRRIGPNY